MSLASKKDSATSRRRFLQLVGLAGITSAVGSSMIAWAQSGPPGVNVKPKKPSAPKAPADTTAAAKPPEISEDAKALAAIVERRYGKHLNSEQLEAITTELNNRIQGGALLRAVKLGNSEEPDFTFKA